MGIKRIDMKDGEPCSHSGCLNHTTHPCEGCGRKNGVKGMKSDREHCIEMIERTLKPRGVVCADMEFINQYVAKSIAEELGIEVTPNHKDHTWEFSHGICPE